MPPAAGAGQANPARVADDAVGNGSARGSNLRHCPDTELYAEARLIWGKGKAPPERGKSIRNVTDGVGSLPRIRGSRQRPQRRGEALERNRNGPDLSGGILEFYLSGQPSLEFIEKVTLQNRPRLAGR